MDSDFQVYSNIQAGTRMIIKKTEMIYELIKVNFVCNMRFYH